MLLRYASGEEVQVRDRVLYHSEASEIEFVAKTDDPETAWYVEQFGGGCMILAPSFGRLFVCNPEKDEDLEFVSRGIGPSN